MTDLNGRLLPNETVQYRYAYPLWLKILAGAALVVVAWMLYDDIRAARYVFVVIEAAISFYVIKWLVQMLRDPSQYVVTDRRVMRLGGKPGLGGSPGLGGKPSLGGGAGLAGGESPADLEIANAQISEVKVVKDTFSGSGYLQVKAADGREIDIPLPSTARSSGERLAEIINRNRGVDAGAQADSDGKSLPHG